LAAPGRRGPARRDGGVTLRSQSPSERCSDDEDRRHERR
jgi:hypothetical protein